MAGIPGKHVYELDNLKILKPAALFPVSQDNLTRSVSLDDLRLSFNGDSDEASKNTYFSTEYMSRYFNDVSDRFSEVNEQIRQTNEDLAQLRKDSEAEDTAIRKHFNDRLNVVSKFSSGTAIPTSLAEGEVYIQYF